MTLSRFVPLLTLALACGLAPAAAVRAQELTAEEMAEAFKKQKTRGLVLVPAQPATPETAATPGASPEAAPAGATITAANPTPQTPAATAEAAATAPATVVPVAATPAYQEVAKEDQVNVQIRFDFDSAALREDQKPKLATLCQVMKSVDVAVFQIIGHTDSAGTDSYNEKLSLLRAQEVKRHLVSDCGVAEGRLQAVGVGESAPYDTVDPGAEINRRVEFQALG